MKNKFVPAVGLILILLANSLNAAAQASFDGFWKNFKAAVAKADKNAVAALSEFPISMPFGMNEIKSKPQFIKRYNEIFKGEADAVKCFPNAQLEKRDSKNYTAYCAFKNAAANSEDKPLAYYFELTKNGWKFVGFDNINE